MNWRMTHLNDLEKAFGKVTEESLMHCLQRLGVHGHMLEILRELHGNLRFEVFGKEGNSSEFPMKRGVRQGDTAAALLFVCVTLGMLI